MYLIGDHFKSQHVRDASMLLGGLTDFAGLVSVGGSAIGGEVTVSQPKNSTTLCRHCYAAFLREVAATMSLLLFIQRE